MNSLYRLMRLAAIRWQIRKIMKRLNIHVEDLCMSRCVGFNRTNLDPTVAKLFDELERLKAIEQLN